MILRAVAVGALTLLLSACVRNSVIAAPLDVVVASVPGRETEVATTSEPSRSAPTWEAKDEVDVEWRGRWWPATILERRGGDRYFVHYDGYGEEWDEVVASERIRLRTVETPGEADDAAPSDADP